MISIRKIIISATMLLVLSQAAFAQSVSYAKSLMENGRYLEAAKQLRPLADGGNAEAQYLAATLFFEGKGVNKNAQQGIKYATMAADQGHEKAVELLLNKSSGNAQLFKIASHYCEKFPDMKKGFAGLALSKCYFEGEDGIEKDFQKGLEIIEQNNSYDDLMEDYQQATFIWNAAAEVAGKNCLEDYADHLYGKKDWIRYNKLKAFILDKLYDDGKHGILTSRAKEGNAWAMAELANKLFDKGDKAIKFDGENDPVSVISLASKSKNAGSAYGQWVYRKVTYVPVRKNNVVIVPTTSKMNVQYMEQGWDYTTIKIKYQQQGYIEWVATGKACLLECDGKYYRLRNTTLPQLPQRKTLTKGEVVYWEWTFDKIPNNARKFTVWEDHHGTTFQIND